MKPLPMLALLALLTAGAAERAGKAWWAHVRYLASDRLEGRATGSEGFRKAAAYVVREFGKAGLEPDRKSVV